MRQGRWTWLMLMGSARTGGCRRESMHGSSKNMSGWLRGHGA
jgi:hypothetical protein